MPRARREDRADLDRYVREPFILDGPLLRFDGPSGWFYRPLPDDRSVALRPLVTRTWPALHPVACCIGEVRWQGSLMPIKDGPLFVAVPAKVRRKLGLVEGDPVRIRVRLLAVAPDALAPDRAP